MNTVRGGKNLIGANGGLLFSNYKDCTEPPAGVVSVVLLFSREIVMGVFSQVCKSGDSFEGMTPPETVRCRKCNGDGELPKEGGAVLFDNEIEKEVCIACEGSGRVPA